MGRRLSRRRWSGVVAYLISVIKNPNGTERHKMQAAMRLSEILMLQEQKEMAATRAQERAEAAANAGRWQCAAGISRS